VLAFKQYGKFSEIGGGAFRARAAAGRRIIVVLLLVRVDGVEVGPSLSLGHEGLL
jgi:hypothetical protein